MARADVERARERSAHARQEVAESERDQIVVALRETSGDVRAAARLLGWPERTAWHRLARHGLLARLPEFRAARPVRA